MIFKNILYCFISDSPCWLLTMPGLKVALSDGPAGQQRKLSGSSGRRLSVSSRSSVMSPTTFTAKNGAREGGQNGSLHEEQMDSSSEEEEEEEESAPDMKALTSGGGDLPQEFWQVRR